MATLPDRTRHQAAFAALSVSERRAIVRAVNRGRVVEVRKHAPLAVGVARRQIRFWRYAWLLGPGLGAVQFAFADPEVALANAIIGTIALGTLAWFWLRRARRAEELNLDIVEGRGRSSGGSSSGDRPGSRPKGHVPGSDDSAEQEEPSSPDHTPRPPNPRGRKRRGRR